MPRHKKAPLPPVPITSFKSITHWMGRELPSKVMEMWELLKARPVCDALGAFIVHLMDEFGYNVMLLKSPEGEVSVLVDDRGKRFTQR